MHCNHCHNTIPGGSRFCPFCGTPLPTASRRSSTPPRYATTPAFKTVFCRQCGQPIDDKTKRCLGCGKQHFRGIPPLVFLCIVLTLALLGLMAVCLILEWQYHTRIHELEQLLALRTIS